MTSKQSPWTGMVSFEDTALATTDTGGTGRPVVYLNGSFAVQQNWRPVIDELGPGYRHITFDERARGRSRRSKDYSFDSAVRDIGAVVSARGVEHPILVGWSFGAAIAVHWADRNPGLVGGVVSVDGAVPFGLTGEEGEEKIRRLFRRMAWMLPLVRPLGMAARMSAAEHAEQNIELNRMCAEMAPLLERLTCPVNYVLATGGSLGGSHELMEEMRASLNTVLARNPNLTVSAKVASNHQKILKQDFRAVAQAVRALTETHTPGTAPSHP
ncbi:alpha/beta hydrolase [Kitasatospora sp. NPDC097643]|uniref:alpha/beta fold hydrolase n=1 Tax=Kitasatospora sp. NPDC097643 TaxID=3157230 RepID=UPI003331442B